MIEIDEALSLVLAHARPSGPRRFSVAESLGLVMAEDIASDIDSPPHDKALVDGYAVCSSDLAGGAAHLSVLEEVTAGDVPTKTVAPGSATRIMTGAPIPAGADAVVMVEQTEIVSAGGQPQVVGIRDAKFRAGQNIMRRAASLARGDVVLAAGHEIRPIEVGLLSEVGRTEVFCLPRPSVSILATGNELVAAGDRPQPGEIRNSNGPMLCALAERAGGRSTDLGIARDNPADLRRMIAEGLQHDVLILSGGVSAGVLDLVPGVLAELGVEQVFHKVNLKPGRPLWFGVARGANRQTLVFGLPGNPVGALVCFELFTRPALGALGGRKSESLSIRRARLAASHRQRGNRPTFWPSVLYHDDSQTNVRPLNWQGSADLRSLADANCLAYFPAGEREFAVGEDIEIRPL